MWTEELPPINVIVAAFGFLSFIVAALVFDRMRRDTSIKRAGLKIGENSAFFSREGAPEPMPGELPQPAPEYPKD